MKDTYVLGAGITGLTGGFLRELPIIGANIGGWTKTQFPISPMYLFPSKYMDELLETLYLSRRSRVAHVGICSNNVFVPFSKDLQTMYSLKSRGVDQPNAMSSGSTAFPVYL